MFTVIHAYIASNLVPKIAMLSFLALEFGFSFAIFLL